MTIPSNYNSRSKSRSLGELALRKLAFLAFLFLLATSFSSGEAFAQRSGKVRGLFQKLTTKTSTKAKSERSQKPGFLHRARNLISGKSLRSLRQAPTERTMESLHHKTLTESLGQKAKGRPVLSGADVVPYAKVMEKNSIEIIYYPNSTLTGHMLLRIGETMYDLGSSAGPRVQTFRGAAHNFYNNDRYGFVFMKSPEEIQKLKVAFEGFVASKPKYSINGTGSASFSCASFITKVLAEQDPKLQLVVSASAIRTASALLKEAPFDAITIYGPSTRLKTKSNFRFKNIE